MRSETENSKGAARRTGSVLILALWTLFFLGALALAVGSHVSAGLGLAERHKTDTAAYFLARAGVERAVQAALSADTNEWAGVTSEYWSRNNETAGHGVFSVTHKVLDPALGQIVTQRGIMRESQKLDINNRRNETALATLIEKFGGANAQDLAREIMLQPARKKKLAEEEGRRYYDGKFTSLYECLLLKGMTDELFAKIEPGLTVYGLDCFSGVAEGAVVGQGADALDDADRQGDVSRIEFVFDRNKQHIVWWREN